MSDKIRTPSKPIWVHNLSDCDSFQPEPKMNPDFTFTKNGSWSLIPKTGILRKNPDSCSVGLIQNFYFNHYRMNPDLISDQFSTYFPCVVLTSHQLSSDTRSWSRISELLKWSRLSLILRSSSTRPYQRYIQSPEFIHPWKQAFFSLYPFQYPRRHEICRQNDSTGISQNYRR